MYLDRAYSLSLRQCHYGYVTERIFDRKIQDAGNFRFTRCGTWQRRSFSKVAASNIGTLHPVRFVLLIQRSDALATVRHLVPSLISIGVAATRSGRTAPAWTGLHGASNGWRGARGGRTGRGISSR